MARHPKRQLLAEWLEGNHSDLDEHIHTCEKLSLIHI